MKYKIIIWGSTILVTIFFGLITGIAFAAGGYLATILAEKRLKEELKTLTKAHFAAEMRRERKVELAQARQQGWDDRDYLAKQELKREI